MPRQRKPPSPVHGSCRWIEPLGPNDTSALIAINGTEYTLHVLEDDAGTLLGYQLVKPDGCVTYEIDAKTFECSCPDSVFRQRLCKHSKALKAALAQLPQPTA